MAQLPYPLYSLASKSPAPHKAPVHPHHVSPDADGPAGLVRMSKLRTALLLPCPWIQACSSLVPPIKGAPAPLSCVLDGCPATQGIRVSTRRKREETCKVLISCFSKVLLDEGAPDPSPWALDGSQAAQGIRESNNGTRQTVDSHSPHRCIYMCMFPVSRGARSAADDGVRHNGIRSLRPADLQHQKVSCDTVLLECQP
jgi:hypothetical protein